MSTTETPEAAAAEPVARLEAELAALRENSARAHRELHDNLTAELTACRFHHEKLRKIHAELRGAYDRERQQRARARAKIERLRVELVRTRQERDAALAARRNAPDARLREAGRRLLAAVARRRSVR